nr:hypothetical protein [Mycobacterium uberis]
MASATKATENALMIRPKYRTGYHNHQYDNGKTGFHGIEGTERQMADADAESDLQRLRLAPETFSGSRPSAGS